VNVARARELLMLPILPINALKAAVINASQGQTVPPLSDACAARNFVERAGTLVGICRS
jgi:hypothetical protein